jgi:hypothetical protein
LWNLTRPGPCSLLVPVVPLLSIRDD